MLENYGIDVEDRQIALDMGLPFLFSMQNGTYCSGPMLQTAEWFNLYLQPKGFLMKETKFSREEVPAFLEHHFPVMLGISNLSGGKHAVVSMGKEKGCWKFVNNKTRTGAEPEIQYFSYEELIRRLESFVMIAALQKITPVTVDLKPYFRNSVNVLSQLKQDIIAFSAVEQTPQALRTAQDILFRAILLDGITMLELLESTELVNTLKYIQKGYLCALRENRPLVLADRIPMNQFEQAIEDYIALIVDCEMKRNPQTGK